MYPLAMANDSESASTDELEAVGADSDGEVGVLVKRQRRSGQLTAMEMAIEKFYRQCRPYKTVLRPMQAVVAPGGGEAELDDGADADADADAGASAPIPRPSRRKNRRPPPAAVPKSGGPVHPKGT